MRTSSALAVGLTTLSLTLTACLSARAPAPAADDAATATPPSGAPAATVPPVTAAALITSSVPAPLERPLPDAPFADLWDRIRAGFRLPREDHESIRVHRDYFADRPGYMERVTERAQPWMHHIVEELAARDMPTDLALLPVVESAFRPFAYSHGRAAGLWQFVPATGRHFGLEQNWWYDGRRDVIAATDAALTYLERLHGMFDGDWLLAVAAYNAGEGNVLQAMRRNRRAGKPTGFWHLNLPRETESYVPRLLALRDIVAEPQAYGLPALPEIPNEPRVRVVDTGSQIDLALAAELAGLTIEELYRLNPGYNRWATAPDGPHRLVLPKDRVEPFRAGLADLSERERMRWQRHRVARGESLIAIARRYHTRPDLIREINDLGGNLIRAGQHLIVPVASRPRGDYVLSASQRLARTQDRERDGKRREYTVRRGDTFWELSRRFDVGMRELARWNGMAPGDTLRPGQSLVVWTDAAGPAMRHGGPRQGRMQSVHYTVRQGDSLSRIASRFKVSVSQLRRWNDIDRGTYLQPGQTLRMEVDVTRQSDG